MSPMGVNLLLPVTATSFSKEPLISSRGAIIFTTDCKGPQNSGDTIPRTHAPWASEGHSLKPPPYASLQKSSFKISYLNNRFRGLKERKERGKGFTKQNTDESMNFQLKGRCVMLLRYIITTLDQ